MGLFDELAKGALGKILGGGGASKQNMLIDLAFNLLSNRQTGGLGGLSELFQSKGLGDAMSSWISTGQNQPVSGDQIASVFGSGQIQEFAKKLGLSGQDVSTGLAAVLPQIIDQLTPKGAIPEESSLEQGMQVLRKSLQG